MCIAGYSIKFSFNLNNIFTVCEPNCLFNMRTKKDFVQKYTRTNIKAMSVSVTGAKLWNELDSDLRHNNFFMKNCICIYENNFSF